MIFWCSVAFLASVRGTQRLWSYAVEDIVFCNTRICNFTASTLSTTWKLVLKRSQTSQQQNIRQNDASEKSLVVSSSQPWLFPPPVFLVKLFICLLFLAESVLRSWISTDILWLICRLICWVLEALVDSFGLLSVELHTHSLLVPLTV